jgi:hypothetical protein
LIFIWAITGIYFTQHFYAENHNGEIRAGVRTELPLPIGGDIQIKVGANQLQMEYLNPCELKDPVRQLRKPTDQQIPKTKRIIDEGGILPIIIDTDGYIIAGWHMAEAARQMDIPYG